MFEVVRNMGTSVEIIQEYHGRRQLPLSLRSWGINFGGACYVKFEERLRLFLEQHSAFSKKFSCYGEKILRGLSPSKQSDKVP